MRIGVSLISGIFCLIPVSALAQEAVSAGKGSYAAEPPPNSGKETADMMSRELFMVDPDAKDRPIPTNDWWTDLIISRYAGALWAYPLKVTANDKGIEVFYPTTW